MIIKIKCAKLDVKIPSKCLMFTKLLYFLLKYFHLVILFLLTVKIIQIKMSENIRTDELYFMVNYN